MLTKRVVEAPPAPFLHEIIQWAPDIENPEACFLELTNAWIREVLPAEELEQFDGIEATTTIGKDQNSPLRRVVRFDAPTPFARLGIDLPLDGRPDHRFEVEYMRDAEGIAIRLQAHEHPDRRATDQARAKAARKRLIRGLKAHEAPPDLGIHLAEVPIHLGTTELVDQFVDEVLQNPDRAVPIILIAETREGEPFDTYADPAVIHEQVRGRTNVYHITREASYQLTERVGRYQSCFHGGIRIYASRVGRRMNPMRHPLLTRFRLDMMRQFDGLTENAIVQTFEAACDDPRESWHRQREFSRRQAAMTSARSTPARGRASRASRVSRRRAHPSTRARNWIPGFELDGWKSERTQQPVPVEIDVPEEVSTTELELDSVRNAALLATVEYADILGVLDSCLKSAGKYKRNACPEEAYKVLAALGDIGRQWRSQDSIGGRFHEVLGRRMKEKYGLSAKASMTESPATMNHDRFRRARTFEGRVMQAHVTLRKGDGNRCLHCFFELDKENGMVLVGYLGEHLKGRQTANS